MGINGRDEIDFQKVKLDELLDMYAVTDGTGNHQFAAQIVDELMRRARADRSPTVITNAPEWLKKALPAVFWRQKDGGAGG